MFVIAGHRQSCHPLPCRKNAAVIDLQSMESQKNDWFKNRSIYRDFGHRHGRTRPFVRADQERNRLIQVRVDRAAEAGRRELITSCWWD